MDVLYPSIKKCYAPIAIKDTLTYTSEYSKEYSEMVIKMVEYCINNSVVQYRGEWFRAVEGIPTGGTESGSIANIYVKWVDKIILTNKKFENNLN